VIYAINSGSVEAREESNGALLWSWRPAVGSATEHLIVTDTHVLARTHTHTHAIELLSGESVWSYPVAGHMAIGEETLYIASDNGIVTAISIPEYTPAALVELEIEGPTEVQEFTTAAYKAWAHYDDGRVRNRTNLTEWSAVPADYASIDEYGELEVQEMLVPSQTIVVGALYREGEAEAASSLDVTLGISVSLDRFVERNVQAALAAKQRALEALEEAEEREAAAIQVVRGDIQGRRGRKNFVRQALHRLQTALFWGVFGQESVAKGAAALEEELNAAPEGELGAASEGALTPAGVQRRIHRR
jgi:hypothetical protein